MKIPNKAKGRTSVYEASLKIAVAQEYLTTGFGSTHLARKYGLPGEATVRHFVKWYKKKYPDQKISEVKVVDNESNKELSKELKEAHLQVMALQMLIENASKELGVDLVKKFGTKQSKK